MFTHEGAARSFRNNEALAAYLAATAGFVNSSGFVLLGTFTSHVTGNVGRLGVELASGDAGVAGAIAILLAAFFAGALTATLVLESGVTRRTPRAYGAALVIEASVLAMFVVVAPKGASAASQIGLSAALLAFAMGLQNSLVTRLSGAVIRTTHLTGVVTDLGIETARWLVATLKRGAADPGEAPESIRIGRLPAAVRPNPARIALLATVASSFAVGAFFGALATIRLQHMAMAIPVAAVLLASAFAFREAHSVDRRSFRPPPPN